MVVNGFVLSCCHCGGIFVCQFTTVAAEAFAKLVADAASSLVLTMHMVREFGPVLNVLFACCGLGVEEITFGFSRWWLPCGIWIWVDRPLVVAGRVGLSCRLRAIVWILILGRGGGLLVWAIARRSQGCWEKQVGDLAVS